MLICSGKHIFLLTNNSRNKFQDIKENYGFKTNKRPTHIKVLNDFEAEFIGLVRLIKYRRISNTIQQQIKNDLKKNLKIAIKIIVKVDKSNYVYKMSTNEYKQMLNKEVIKHYQKAPLNLENELN